MVKEHILLHARADVPAPQCPTVREGGKETAQEEEGERSTGERETEREQRKGQGGAEEKRETDPSQGCQSRIESSKNMLHVL